MTTWILPLHHWRQADLDGVTAYIHRTDPSPGTAISLPAAPKTPKPCARRLAAAGIVAIDEAAYEYLRIESGLPRFGRELTLDYIPLEANLWDDVSFHKGCYTGQEIIARMESRGKLAKRLVPLRPAAPVAAGSAILAGDREVGTITSAADGPAGPLALGYVNGSRVDADPPLMVGERSDRGDLAV